MSLLTALTACAPAPHLVTSEAGGPPGVGFEADGAPPSPEHAEPLRAQQVPRGSAGAGQVPPDPVRTRGPAGVTPLVRIDLRALEDEILLVVNRERARAGSGPLTPVPAMNRTARLYAVELAERGEIEHASSTPGRRTFRQRIEIEGVRARIAGENLARLTASPERLAPQVVDAWMRSRGHRMNMLDRTFTRTGLGAWLGPDGVWYVVQVFATPS
jgi:uncharacterized protein YkwD